MGKRGPKASRLPELLATISDPNLDREKCLEWKGTTNNAGYGLVYVVGKKRKLVHRVSLEHHLGRPLGNKMLACHNCDNPICFNPYHLFEGTYADNARDCVAKGRANRASGEQHGHAKLTAAQVREIRLKYRPRDYTMGRLADEYGVTASTISSILSGHLWPGVEFPAGVRSLQLPLFAQV